MIGAIVSAVTALGTKALDWWGSRTEAERAKAVAEIETAGQVQLAAMKARGDWVVIAIVALWSGPMVHGYLDPAAAGRLAEVLALYPAWYVDGVTKVTLGVLGLSMIARRR